MTSLDILAQTLAAIAGTVWVTLFVALGATAVGVFAGCLSVMLQLGGGRVGAFLSRLYVSLMRGTPLLVQLFVVFFGLPLLGVRIAPVMAAILGIGLNSGAYCTEILRGAILGIAPGQVEAARCLGFGRLDVWRRILLPQALATSLPMLVAESSIVLKSTPLASVISVTEMTYAGVLIQARTFSAIEVFLPIALTYVAIHQAMALLARRLERRLAPRRA